MGGLLGGLFGGSSFDVNIDKVANIDPITLEPITINPLSITQVKDVEIDRVQKIAPVATHIKEINNIDPVSIEAFNVTQIRNIEPLRVEELNITKLPNVNISLRQWPPMEMNIRRLPPVSVGFSQDIRVPSHYLVRMQFLGFEFMRVALSGESCLLPQERYRREQERTHDRSFPETAAAGNPAIPSFCREIAVTECNDCGSNASARGSGTPGLNCGQPAMNFPLSQQARNSGGG